MDLGLADRAALVCGASSGLGLAIATALADEGTAVAINARSADALAEAATPIGAVPIAGDVTTDAADIVARAAEALGRLDILVCNAGGPAGGPFSRHAPDAFERALRLNLLSTVSLARAALPGMRKQRWGRIICVTSVAALQTEPNLILSTMARAGVHGFAKTLADEVAAEGVTVNAVAPGFIGTDRLGELFDDDARAALAERIPAGRIGDPAELAAAVAFLASEPARYITGAVLRVDGGYVRSIM